MNDITEERVADALKMMGYAPEEIDELAKAEVKHLLEMASSMDEALTVNLEEECPTIPDEE